MEYVIRACIVTDVVRPKRFADSIREPRMFDIPYFAYACVRFELTILKNIIANWRDRSRISRKLFLDFHEIIPNFTSSPVKWRCFIKNFEKKRCSYQFGSERKKIFRFWTNWEHFGVPHMYTTAAFSHTHAKKKVFGGGPGADSPSKCCRG